ncbi:MBL fold metallo-hydrolase [Priestia koreensis]|uniref:MBL fold metallo-hydrolase n=1 Tax=Priestia koreensis TaxID=284581 RepID=UPI0028F71CAF|nr:MBL fold metallo-hydrolase [Priestia koreensis]
MKDNFTISQKGSLEQNGEILTYKLKKRGINLEAISTILILLGMVGGLLGIIGVIKGNVRILRLASRKTSAFSILVAFIMMMIGAAVSPSVDQPSSKEGHTKVKVEQKEASVSKTEDSHKVAEKDAPVSVAPKSSAKNNLEVHFVDVGQGAAQVIVMPNKKVMVIDGGNNDDEETMVAYLQKLGVKKVDVVIGTHPDADHIGGIDAVIDSFDIGKVYMPKIQSNTQTFQSVLTSIKNKGLKVTTAKAGLALSLDPNVKVDMISPMEEDSHTNEMSAVVHMQYGTKSFLLTGDAGIPTEKKWIQSGANLKSTVLLTGHHGSNHSTSEELVNAVQPTYAVIQVGKNSYGHPTSEVLDRLHRHSVKIYRNDTDGTIVFKTNGTNMEVNKHEWAYTGKKTAGVAVPKPAPKAPPVSSAPKAPSYADKLTATASIDDNHPHQNEEVTVTVTVKNETGQPVGGADVTLNLAYKSTDTTYTAVTNAQGVAMLPFRIGRAAAGYTVNGDISIAAQGMSTTAHTDFTPN